MTSPSDSDQHNGQGTPADHTYAPRRVAAGIEEYDPARFTHRWMGVVPGVFHATTRPGTVLCTLLWLHWLQVERSLLPASAAPDEVRRALALHNFARLVGEPPGRVARRLARKPTNGVPLVVPFRWAQRLRRDWARREIPRALWLTQRPDGSWTCAVQALDQEGSPFLYLNTKANNGTTTARIPHNVLKRYSRTYGEGWVPMHDDEAEADAEADDAGGERDIASGMDDADAGGRDLRFRAGVPAVRPSAVIRASVGMSRKAAAVELAPNGYTLDGRLAEEGDEE